MKILKNLILGLITALVFLAALEGLQRVRHPHVGFRNMRNSLGFRSPEFNPRKASGTFRILFIGSSTTFGVNGPVEQTFPYLTGKILREKLSGIAVEAINAAEPCKTSLWELARLRETLSLEPDMVVVMSGYNDSATVYESLVRRGRQGGLDFSAWPVKLSSVLARYSVLYVTLMEKIAILRYGTPLRAFNRPPDPEAETKTDAAAWFESYPPQFRNNLDQMIRTAFSRHARLVFIKAPLSGQRRREHPLYEKAYLRLMEELVALASERRIPLIDLDPEFSGQDTEKYFSADGLHFTAQGNMKIAETVAGFLLEGNYLRTDG